MYDKYNSQQILLNTKHGLQRVYQALNMEDLNGLSVSEIINSNKIAINDIPFAQLLQQEFSKIDENRDEIISAPEIEKLIKNMEDKGLTYEQLMALSQNSGSIPGTNKTLLETVIENFNKVDANHDGKVSSAEINSYKLKEEIDEKEKSLNEFKASNISFFYDESTAEETSTESKTK